MRFVDVADLGGTRRRADGYMVADARVARTGIQTYAGWEVGRPDMTTVNVYRPGEEVFSDEALRSFAHRPITNDHPDEEVNSGNWREYAVGQTGDEIMGEAIFVRVPMMVSDEKTIAAIEGGKRELSAGYTCDLDWSAGKTPAGETYDAIQRNIRANHIAIVDRGRAGSQVRIGDDTANWGAAPITHHADERTVDMADKLRTVVVDGLSVETTDQGAQAIEKLEKDKAAVEARLSDAEKAHEAAIKAKDAEIAKKDAEIDKVKGKVLDQAAIDKLVADRASLEGIAARIAKDVDPKGLSDADLRKAIVENKLGKDAVADKSEAYIDARFDILAEDTGKADPVRDAFKGRDRQQVAADNGQAAYEKRLADAWKGEAA